MSTELPEHLRAGAVPVDTGRSSGKFALRKGPSRGKGVALSVDFDDDLSGGTVQENAHPSPTTLA